MQWENGLSGECFDDYEEARESVLEYLRYEEDDYIWEVIKEACYPSEILKGLVEAKTGEDLAERIMNELEDRFLSDYLILIDEDEDEGE